jgi:hypothetical protein
MIATHPEPTQPQPDGVVYASLRHMVTSVVTALPLDPRGTPDDQAMQRDAAVALLGTLHPNDAVEHMLSARIATAHFAMLECFRRFAVSEPSDPTAERWMKLAEAMDRMGTRALNRLKRSQTAASGKRRHGPTVSRGIPAPSDCQNPMPAPERSPPTSDIPPLPQEPATGQQPAASARSAPHPVMPARQHDPVRPEDPPNPPQPATPLAFDRDAWRAAVRTMSLEVQFAIANCIQGLRQEPLLPARMAG